MACFSSVVEVLFNCEDKTAPGVEKLYCIAANDLKAYSTASTSTYSADTNGLVVGVGLASGKTFVEIQGLINTVSVGDEVTKDNTKGYNFQTQTLNFRLRGITQANKKYFDTVKGQPVAFIYKTRSESYFVVGLNGQMELSAGSSNTGAAPTDDYGWTMTFTGYSPETAMFINPSLVPTLIS